MELNQTIKKKLNKNWKKIEKQKQFILSNVSKKFSLIRLGDGELSVLFYKDKYYPIDEYLIDSIRNCDILGLPSSFGFTGQNHPKNWDLKIIETCKSLYNYEIDKSKIIGATLFNFIPEIIGDIVSNKKILWITAGGNKLVDNLKDRKFRDYYNFKTSLSDYIDVPDSKDAYPLKYNLENILEKVKRELKGKVFDIALIGAGVLGKLYCDIIKKVYNKIAIDIGSLASAYQGKINRISFEKNHCFEDLVWKM